MSIYTTVMLITIQYESVYIHVRNEKYILYMTVSIYTTIMQITIHCDSVYNIYTKIMQINIHYSSVYIYDCNANKYSL